MKRTAWKGRARIVERYAAAAVLTLVGSVVIILFQHLRGVPDALVFAAIVALSARFLGTGPRPAGERPVDHRHRSDDPAAARRHRIDAPRGAGLRRRVRCAR